jgi:hypothetical protein
MQINKLQDCEICSSLFICPQCSKQLDDIVDDYLESDINDMHDEISSIKLNDNSSLDTAFNLIDEINLHDCNCSFECRCLHTILVQKELIKNINTLKFIAQNLSSDI